MKVLFFDATQDWIHVSATILSSEKPGESIYEFKEYCPKESSFRLVEEIQKALQSTGWGKPDRIFVLTGPGSFTGIRITVTTARNLSQLWQIPCLGMDTIEAYCKYFSQTKNKKSTFVCLDGKQKKHYFGHLTEGNYSGTFDWTSAKIEEYLKNLQKEDVCFVYSGETNVQFYKEMIKIEETLPESMPILETKKDTILRADLKTSNYSLLLPNYIRGTYLETNTA
ncbi:tRNA (adenosine(37)-N6)-threonylcarbamoyltransferase complex dimerization subunit type 1 TsaB [Leptospira ilyithenensis]|uniref:tRNA (Adenosine(37)-N6)-threonylcarbamoyltransferase complex dimerization subunit type 1 TsaB n=1 Tax=Leptospira ilyithenensis TaxID=2484901 RepID=A0A4R9LPI6_9LEPT|nr:tRNA (adenosine(37)-N6)-threonylcarbamoyltransferase complex dimerization subunit type 1 TsaB [Leptospira ilyithenensis]TGN10994.1 tRNA (adenosine(37)-N6)-threonylcarbamoyltransferase complex dimerization subunit type 1 TsaB [Leptospira ilyithenensis]